MNSSDKGNCFEVLLTDDPISIKTEEITNKKELLKGKIEVLIHDKCLSRVMKFVVFLLL